MTLVTLTVTPRKRAANRSNARRSTGPRTRAGKARSRLNALKDGRYSVLMTRYLRLWYVISVNGPLRPPPGWKLSQMPVPLLSRSGDKRRGEEIRELLWSVRSYLPLRQRGLPRGGVSKPQRLPAGVRQKNKESFFAEPSHEVVENTRGVRANVREKRINEPRANPRRTQKIRAWQSPQ